MEKKLKHLEFIQGVVNRMAQNSFLLKGWSVVLVSALFALSAKDSNPGFIFLAYVPAFIFWGLDGYFLWQERLFRHLFNHVRGISEANVDFSMDVLAVESEDKEWKGWVNATLSKTLIPFHGALISAIIIVMSFYLKG